MRYHGCGADRLLSGEAGTCSHLTVAPDGLCAGAQDRSRAHWHAAARASLADEPLSTTPLVAH